VKNRSAIITGDDFGFSSEVNRAIIEAHERGVLTSTSLMVTGEAFEEAVAMAHSHPELAVGLHLVVICGRSAAAPHQIPHLVDPRGQFSTSPTQAGLRYQFSRAARGELRLEIRSQLEKFRKTGLRLSHVDGHLHMHMHPIVLEALLKVANEFEIRAIRLPWEELGITLRVNRSDLLTKCATSWIFGRLRRYGERRLKSAGIEFTDRVYGLLQSGRMTEDYLLGLIPQIRADRIEIYSHPTTRASEGRPTRSRGASQEQLEALLSERVREALDASGFTLATYSQVNGCTTS